MQNLHRKFVELGRQRNRLLNEMLAKELRAKSACGDGCAKADCVDVGVGQSSTCCAVPVRVKVELDEELSFLFMKLKQKWGMSNKGVMRALLTDAVATEFPEKKVSIKAMRTQIAKQVNVVTGGRHEHAEGARSVFAANDFSKPKKYINTYKQRATLSETGGCCSYPGCNKPAVNFHHPDRWSITKNHDNIRPLCKEHHEFPHNGLIEDETSENWQLNINGKLKTEADVLYRKCRQEVLL